MFRFLSWIYVLMFASSTFGRLAHPRVAWVLLVVLTVWSVVCGAAYWIGFGRRRGWVVAEAVVTVALMASTRLVASPEWTLANQALPTTLWATNVVVSAAILAGPIWGMAAVVLILGTAAALKGAVSTDVVRSPTIIQELAVALVVGMVARTARRAHRELQQATRLSAAMAERERLSRHVHDGVLQVLAMVARRGREIGGEATPLAQLAGEQERALRSLLSGADLAAPGAPVSKSDLGAVLRRHETANVSVSLPAEPVYLDSSVVDELDAAVRNALTNVARHAGPGARGYVLLEDLDDSVVVSIRDDGLGIPAGRLAEAAAQGRIGIAKSIQGRMISLGGSAVLTTPPGGGTEWELAVPK